MAKIKSDTSKPISQISKILHLSYNSVLGMVNRGELKLDDYDWVTNDSFDKYLSENPLMAKIAGVTAEKVCT